MSLPVTAVPTSSIQDTGCVTRTINNTVVGLGMGVVLSVALVSMKASNVLAKLSTGAVFASTLKQVLPLSAGVALMYTGVSCTVEASRNKIDWVSHAAGGAVAAGVAKGIMKASPVAAFSAACVGALVACAPDIAEAMGPTTERANAKSTREAIAAEAAVTSSQAYAANVAAVNKYATSKLQ